MAKDLFKVIVREDRSNPAFKAIRDSKGFEPAREMLNEVFQSFDDVDGNFVEEFQSDGFNARLWELYLNVFFKDSRFEVNRSYKRPDFEIEKDGRVVFVEAVTSNPTKGDDEIVSVIDKFKREKDEEKAMRYLSELRKHYAIKIGSALFSKLRQKYWESPRVTGKPLVFALEPFHHDLSLYFSDSSLCEYLYGLQSARIINGKVDIRMKKIDKHYYGEKTIPSNYFGQDGAENISAILFSNAATISKFNRMGFLKGYGRDQIRMHRFGTSYDPDPDALLPLRFSYEVGDPRFPETWGQGLSLYHNPNARNPLPEELFRNITQGWLRENRIICDVPTWHPFMSQTLILIIKH